MYNFMCHIRFSVFILFLVLLTSLAACVPNPRMQQFTQISEAGQIYGKAAESFLHQRAKVELERNSLIARELHNSQQDNERIYYIREQNKLASSTYTLMQRNAEQSRPFANYFFAFGELAQHNNGNNIEVSARQLADAVGEINGMLKNPMEVSLHVYPFVSSQLLQNSLDTELESRKGLLLDALNVYQGMLGDVSAAYQHNLAMQMNSTVITPYSGTQVPNTCWTQRRKNLIIEQSSVRAAHNAFGRSSDSLSRAILNMSNVEPNAQALGSLMADMQDLQERVSVLEQPRPHFCVTTTNTTNNNNSNNKNNNNLPILSSVLSDNNMRTELPVKPVFTSPTLAPSSVATIDFTSAVISQNDASADNDISNNVVANNNDNGLCGMNMYGPVQEGETLFAVARALQQRGIGADVGLSRLAATVFVRNKTVFKQENINRLAPASCLTVPSNDDMAAMSSMQASSIIAGQ